MDTEADTEVNAETAVQDPVCGKDVDPLRARAVGIFGGVTHYFCSPECKVSFGDPRSGPTVPHAGPGGIERRYTDRPLTDVAGDESGQWFVQPRPAPIERFDDLEAPPPMAKQAPSPSILIDVRASKPLRGRVVPIAVALAVVAALVAVALLVHAMHPAG